MSFDQHLRPSNELSEAHNWDHLGSSDLDSYSWIILVCSNDFRWCILYSWYVRAYFYTTLLGEEAVSPKIISSGKPSEVRSSLTSVDRTNTHSVRRNKGRDGNKGDGRLCISSFPRWGRRKRGVFVKLLASSPGTADGKIWNELRKNSWESRAQRREYSTRFFIHEVYLLLPFMFFAKADCL